MPYPGYSDSNFCSNFHTCQFANPNQFYDYLYTMGLLFALALIIQLELLLSVFIRIFFLPKAKALPVADRKPVSIIICAKNEAANLTKNLPFILSQNYLNEYGVPNFEVIVVNDGSTDNTQQVLEGFAKKHTHLKIVNLSPDEERVYKGKKHALGKGVNAAQNEWLLFTDADCKPSSEHWLELMVAPLFKGKEIIIGYGGYNTTQGLLNAFIRWETLHAFMLYSTAAQSGRPYMAVGRNMACLKSVFIQAQESPIWNAVPSGDDDLLISVAATQVNTQVVSDKAAFTYSDAKETWDAWAKQKQRHLSTGKFYKRGIKTYLTLYAGGHAMIWIFFVATAIAHPTTLLFGAMGLRCFLYWAIWLKTADKVNEKSLFYFFPLFDLGWMVYNFAFLPYIIWKNKKHWT